MSNLKFGLFQPPIHSPRHPVADLIERDLDLTEWVDALGYHSIWFGEHHSSGYETIPAPELMIAAALQRTSRIELCTGVISLPYHHPMMVADRIAFLDNMARGRTVFGVGPGALPRDSYMLGMDYTQLRGRMEESLQAILRLFTSEELVEAKTEWFELREARLQLRGYTDLLPRMSVASAVSPSGPRLAGRYGLGLLSFGASSPEGFKALGTSWSIAEEEADRAGSTISRDDWSVVDMIYVAETKKQAVAEVAYGLPEFFEYQQNSTPAEYWTKEERLTIEQMADRINESGAGVIGTPEMAVEHIKRKIELTGGFGQLLFFANDWGDPAATKRMYELFAREVMPRFTVDNSRRARLAEYEYMQANHDHLMGRLSAGWSAAKNAYDVEKHARS